MNVRAEGLPFRSQQRGAVGVLSDIQPLIKVPVMAQVSLDARGVAAGAQGALGGLSRGAGRLVGEALGLMADVTGAINRFGARHAWVIWLLWLLASAGIGVGLWYLPDSFNIQMFDRTLLAPVDLAEFVLPVFARPAHARCRGVAAVCSHQLVWSGAGRFPQGPVGIVRQITRGSVWSTGCPHGRPVYVLSRQH